MTLNDIFAYGTFFFESLADLLQATPFIWFWGLIAVIIIVKMFIDFCKFK